MRTPAKRSIITMVASLAFLTLSSAASALTVVLEWSGSGSNVTGTNFTGSEVVTLEVYGIVTVPPGLDMVAVSIGWDSNALSLVTCTLANNASPQLVAGGSFQPAGAPMATCPLPYPDEQPSLGQMANSPPYLPGPGYLHIADLVFHVTGGVDGNTVVQSFFNPVSDGWTDNNWIFSLNAIHGTATVHVDLPELEPNAALLVGCGFLSLLAVGRRRRRG